MDHTAGLAARRPDARAFVLVPLLYWIGAFVGSRLAITPGGISLLWAPNAVLIAAFLRYDGAGWAAFGALAVLAELAADLPQIPAVDALVYGGANVLEATVAWGLLRTWSFDPRFPRVVDLGRFVLAGPMVGALCGAVAGTAVMRLVAAPSDTFADDVLGWWLGDGLGVMIFTPVYLSHVPPRLRERAPVRSRPGVDVAMFVGGLVTLVLLVTESAEVLGQRVRPHLLIPFVLYASVRLPFRWVCVLVMVLALLLVALTVDGRPPFGLAAPSIAAITVQEFVMVVSVLSLGVSSLLAHLRVREEELHRANEELRRRTVALERNNRELQRIAYVASHDLQTPLRSISGFSQLLRRRYGGRLGPTADDWIRRVTDNTQRLERLLRALGDVAAVDTAGAPFAPVDLNAVFAAATADLDAEIRAAAAVVTRDELPVVVGDRVQLLRVMRELICNALTARGRAPTSIHVSAREDLREWIVSVRDDGVGIPAGEQERVFNLFYRTAGPGPAVGAGLALCARVVHRHGGRIWVESTPGAGSTFSFSIPKDAADVVA